MVLWSHTAILDFGTKFRGALKVTKNNGLRFVEWRMNSDNVCVLGAKGNAGYYSAPGESNGKGKTKERDKVFLWR